MFWRYFWMWDSKRSKLEIKFRPYALIISDWCFIQNLSCKGQNKVTPVKLTSIHFYTYMARKIKKKKDWNRSLQSQVSYSASFDHRPFWLEYLGLETSIWCKLNFVRFLTQRPINLPNFSKQRAHMKEIWFSKTTYKFY
jgi:hypothetical protein